MSNIPDPQTAAAAPSALFTPDLTPPQPANALVTQPDAAPPAERDAHGFDPAEYKWVPVLRKPRKDGWTPQRQVEFIRALANTGTVREAALRVAMSANSCYELRNAPDGASFAAAWNAALAQAVPRLIDSAFERAFNGCEEPVFDKEGNRVGRRMKQNDRLLMFLLRAYQPERFRHAHRDTRMADEALPPQVEPLGDALKRLEPPTPPEPHRLMPPHELDVALEVADIMEGELPHYYTGTPDFEPVDEERDD